MEIVNLKKCLTAIEDNEYSFFANIDDQMEILAQTKYIAKYQITKKLLHKALDKYKMEELSISLALDFDNDVQNILFALKNKDNEKIVLSPVIMDEIGDILWDHDVSNVFYLGSLREGRSKILISPDLIDNLDEIFLNTELLRKYRNDKLSIELNGNNENTIFRKIKV